MRIYFLYVNKMSVFIVPFSRLDNKKQNISLIPVQNEILYTAHSPAGMHLRFFPQKGGFMC